MVKPTVNIHYHTNSLAAVMKALRALGTTDVLVGYPEDTTERNEDDGPTNAQLAFINNQGSPAQRIPQREFMVSGTLQKKISITNYLEQAGGAALDGHEDRMNAAFDAAGIEAVSGIKNRITTGEFAPLSPFTLRMRKRAGFQGEKPLQVTNQLLNATNFVRRRRRGGINATS